MQNRKVKGFMLVDVLLGSFIGAVVLLTAISFSGVSLNTVFSQYSGTTNRMKAYSLTGYFIDDVKSAPKINISGDNKKLEIIRADGSPKTTYEFDGGSLYITENGASPMMALRAAEITFSEDDGLIRLATVLDKRSELTFDIEVMLNGDGESE